MKFLGRALGLFLIFSFLLVQFASMRSQAVSEQMADENWAGAAQSLAQVIPILDTVGWAQPQLRAWAHNSSAIVHLNLGDYAEAKKEADIAVAMNPKEAHPLFTSAAVSTAQGHLAEAISAFKEVIAKFPDDPLALKAKEQLRSLTKEEALEATAAKHPDKANEYFNYATARGTVKWKNNKFPLSVYIPGLGPSRHPKSVILGGSQPSPLSAAFRAWQNGAHNQVQFRYVDSPAAADIDCKWVDSAAKLQDPNEGGDAAVTADSEHGITHVTITLLSDPDGAHSKHSVRNTIASAALHEIGHSLGLLGHSPDPKDIMFFATAPGDRYKPLSDRDIETLKHLYSPSVHINVHGMTRLR